MKLYLAPGACSLASHIALHEAGQPFEHVKVDLRSKKTADGADFAAVNPKGYVPALVLDGGETLTENVAVLDWISHRHAPLKASGGELAHVRQLEMLAFVSTEIHKQFGRVFFPTSDAEKQAAVERIGKRLSYLAERLKSDYLFGDRMTVADTYLYVMLRWADGKQIEVPAPLRAFKQRMEALPSVQRALQDEGLDSAAKGA